MKSFSIRNFARANGFWCILPVFFALLAAAADDEPAWRSKQIAEWSVEDANQVLFDSPWAKTFTPVLTAPEDSGRRPGGIGRELGGVGRDAVDLAIPGIAGRRATGSASPGGESPAGQSTGSSSSDPPNLRFAGRARCRCGRQS